MRLRKLFRKRGDRLIAFLYLLLLTLAALMVLR
jgi:hypothetical protein